MGTDGHVHGGQVLRHVTVRHGAGASDSIGQPGGLDLRQQLRVHLAHQQQMIGRIGRVQAGEGP